LKNLKSLCHVEFILKLLLWFECVHVLIKFAQGRDVLVCNSMDNVNLTQQELFKLYNNPFTKHEDSTIDDFNYPLILPNDTFPMN